LVDRLIVDGWQTVPERGVVSHVNHLNFGRHHISGTAEASVVKFLHASTDRYRRIRVYAWYITPKRDEFRVTWPL